MSGLDYYLADPTGNITLLCVSPCEKADFRDTARALMRAEPTAEQAGFISFAENGDIRLDMSGGEFCGNATMSAAAFYCRREGIKEGTVSVSVSGVEKPLPVSVRKTEENSYACAVKMPPVLSVSRESLTVRDREYSFPLVRMPGIIHAVCEQELSDAEAEELVRIWCAELDSEAMGLMMLDRDRGSIRPLVYVAGIDSLFWENSCASGSAGAGAYLAKSGGIPVEMDFLQPGGTLRVKATPDGNVILSGEVRLSEKRRLEL